MSKATTAGLDLTPLPERMPPTHDLEGEADEVLGRVSGGDVWHRVNRDGSTVCSTFGDVEHFRPKSFVSQYGNRPPCQRCFEMGERINWEAGVYAANEIEEHNYADH